MSAALRILALRASTSFCSAFPLASTSARSAVAAASNCLLRAGVPNAPTPQLVSLSSYRFLATAAYPGPSAIRDFAIIAHVDHGKTTLFDRLLAHCGTALAEERVMDSNVLEKERGITISSKYTSMSFKGHMLNAVDTPGHADFGGEVERILSMVDGALLLVDANEGPLSQTKFVVEKALKHGLRPIVVLNKVDREGATQQRCNEVESQLFDLFAQMGASDDQLDFPVLYTSARQGWASRTLPEHGKGPAEADGMGPLLDTVLDHVPAPAGNPEAPFSMLVAMLERDAHLGRVATGRVAAGVARVGDRLKVLHHEGKAGEEAKLTKIWKRSGTGRIDLDTAGAGDIVSVTGIPTAGIADTICATSVDIPLAPGPIDPPTLSMIFSPNDSPLAGRGGLHLTGTKIGERLMQEAETSVSLRVLNASGASEAFEVQARGELQLGLLIENMRREGFEFAVSPPRVVYRMHEGQRQEPMEEVHCELEDAHAGSVIEALSLRRAELVEMIPLQTEGKQKLVFECPSRGLIGFRTIFATLTRGSGLMHRAFSAYGPWKGPMDQVRKGVLISTADGKTTSHALGLLEPRGVLFTEPGTDVYGGMIIGEHSRESDLEVNPVREKKLTNVRNTGSEERVSLSPPRSMTLEDAIGFVAGDELIEVTPSSVRLRKRILESSRRRSDRRSAAA